MKKFLDNLAGAVLWALVALVLGAVILWWPVYKYHDCRRVGHSTLYCVMDIGH